MIKKSVATKSASALSTTAPNSQKTSIFRPPCQLRCYEEIHGEIDPTIRIKEMDT